VYAAVAARHGVAAAPAAVEERFRVAFRQMPALAFPDAAPGEVLQHEYAWWQQVVAAAFAGERFDDFDAFFHELFNYFARAEAWQLYGDVEPSVAALQSRGLRLGVISNFDGRLLRICEALGIAAAFDAVVMSGRVGYAKPDRRIFAAALAQLGVTPEEALHVGDNEREDVAGARAAGLHALLLRRDVPVSAPSHVPDLCALVDWL
jgi:putative hydrolase of the HAD superfamily